MRLPELVSRSDSVVMILYTNCAVVAVVLTAVWLVTLTARPANMVSLGQACVTACHLGDSCFTL